MSVKETIMTKLISVIVPVYNVEDYLGRFLKSVKDQTMDMNQVEVIIVNDGSTDDSLSVLSKFSEQHDRCLKRKRRRSFCKKCRT